MEADEEHRRGVVGLDASAGDNDLTVGGDRQRSSAGLGPPREHAAPRGPEARLERADLEVMALVAVNIDDVDDLPGLEARDGFRCPGVGGPLLVELRGL